MPPVVDPCAPLVLEPALVELVAVPVVLVDALPVVAPWLPEVAVPAIVPDEDADEDDEAEAEEEREDAEDAVLDEVSCPLPPPEEGPAEPPLEHAARTRARAGRYQAFHGGMPAF
jgi:hypothetical protein